MIPIFPEIRHGIAISEMMPLDGPTADLVGVWLSNGYGNLVEVGENGLKTWQYTSDICLPSNEDSSSLIDDVDFYKLSDDGNSLYIGVSEQQHTYEFTRLDNLPETCHVKTENNALANFEAFVSLMSEHYAFFELHDLDWDKEVKSARKRVKEGMSDQKLFDLLSQMMQKIDDSHLFLKADLDSGVNIFNPNLGNAYAQVEKRAESRGKDRGEGVQAFRRSIWLDSIQNKILGGKGKMVAGGRIQYGVIDDDIGYFIAVSASNYSENDEIETDLSVLARVMDNAMTLFNEIGVKAVILDNSINHGGYDYLSRELASHFTNEKVKIYSKRASDAVDPYQTQLYLNPTDGVRYNGPVYMLNSDMTVSAGEMLAMAMNALPNVTLVGEPTRGALSDVLFKTLPNGWEMGISNEVYLDHQGKFWENRGVEPDWPIPVFSEGKLSEGHLEAIGKIIKKIQAN